jgi:hypothetical protein
MLIPEHQPRLTARRLLALIAVWGLLGVFAWLA